MNKAERIKIKNTDYYVGKLYVYNAGEKHEEPIYVPNIMELNLKEKDDNLFYNQKKGYGDCHFLPQDKNVAEECVNKICDLKNNIMRLKQENFKLCASGGISILSKYGYDNSRHNLFHCIRYKENDCTYEIIFIRFYKTDENEEINCILNSLQFCAYTGSIQSIDYYPNSCEDGIELKRENGVYYNPYSSFDTVPEKIVEEFKEFINRNSRLDTL